MKILNATISRKQLAERYKNSIYKMINDIKAIISDESSTILSKLPLVKSYYQNLLDHFATYHNLTITYGDRMPYAYRASIPTTSKYFSNEDIMQFSNDTILPCKLPDNTYVNSLVSEYHDLVKDASSSKEIFAILQNTEFLLPSLPHLIESNLEYFKEAGEFLIGREKSEDLYIGVYFFPHQKGTTKTLFHRDHDNLHAQLYRHKEPDFKMISYQLTLVNGNDNEDALLMFPPEEFGVLTPREAFMKGFDFILEYNKEKFNIGLNELFFILALAEYSEHSTHELVKAFGYDNEFPLPLDYRVFGSLAESILIMPYSLIKTTTNYPKYVTTNIGEGFFFNGNSQYHGYSHQNLSQDRLTISIKIFTEKSCQDIYESSPEILVRATKIYPEISDFVGNNYLCSFIKIDDADPALTQSHHYQSINDSPCKVMTLGEMLSLQTGDLIW